MARTTQIRLVFTAVTLTLTAVGADSHEWRWITPRIDSQVKRLQQRDAEAVLSEFCEGSLKLVAGIGLTCSTRALGSKFADVVDNGFHPEGIIYGHFLTSTSEDALVSGWSAETHPSLWGGTLLLTKRGGKWTPLWYKSSVLTHSCRKLAMPSGREMLLCEEEDSGMGAQIHYLYSVDPVSPVDIRKALLVVAQSFNDGCTVRRQVIQRVAWVGTERHLVVTLATPEWRYVSSASCAGIWLRRATRPPVISTLEFELTDTGFRPVQGRE
jgi:hypothetical protein